MDPPILRLLKSVDTPPDQTVQHPTIPSMPSSFYPKDPPLVTEQRVDDEDKDVILQCRNLNELYTRLSKISSASSHSFKEYSPMLSAKQSLLDNRETKKAKQNSRIIVAKLYSQTNHNLHKRNGVALKT